MAHDKKMGSACEVSLFPTILLFFSVDLRCNGATIRYARNVESHYTACTSGRVDLPGQLRLLRASLGS